MGESRTGSPHESPHAATQPEDDPGLGGPAEHPALWSFVRRLDVAREDLSADDERYCAVLMAQTTDPAGLRHKLRRDLLNSGRSPRAVQAFEPILKGMAARRLTELERNGRASRRGKPRK